MHVAAPPSPCPQAHAAPASGQVSALAASQSGVTTSADYKGGPGAGAGSAGGRGNPPEPPQPSSQAALEPPPLLPEEPGLGVDGATLPIVQIPLGKAIPDGEGQKLPQVVAALAKPIPPRAQQPRQPKHQQRGTALQVPLHPGAFYVIDNEAVDAEKVHARIDAEMRKQAATAKPKKRKRVSWKTPPKAPPAQVPRHVLGRAKQAHRRRVEAARMRRALAGHGQQGPRAPHVRALEWPTGIDVPTDGDEPTGIDMPTDGDGTHGQRRATRLTSSKTLFRDNDDDHRNPRDERHLPLVREIQKITQGDRLRTLRRQIASTLGRQHYVSKNAQAALDCIGIELPRSAGTRPRAPRIYIAKDHQDADIPGAVKYLSQVIGTKRALGVKQKRHKELAAAIGRVERVLALCLDVLC